MARISLGGGRTSIATGVAVLDHLLAELADTGGFALNFYKTRSRLARTWSERSRQEILGLWPQFALGSSVSDRNTMVERDLSGLHPGRRKPEVGSARAVSITSAPG